MKKVLYLHHQTNIKTDKMNDQQIKLTLDKAGYTYGTNTKGEIVLRKDGKLIDVFANFQQIIRSFTK